MKERKVEEEVRGSKGNSVLRSLDKLQKKSKYENSFSAYTCF